MFKDHHSVLKIANNHDGQLFTLKPVSVQEMEKIISHVNPRKATGFDQFPPKLLRTVGFAIAPSLTSLVNHIIACSQFSADLKCAELSPVFKKDDILDNTKYRPLSILRCISNIMEGVIANQARIYFSAILDVCISTFRKVYNTQSILLKAIEDWKMALDEGKYVQAILMDLSKAFDVIHHGLLIAKLHAYGCDDNVLNLMLGYFNDRKQRTKIGASRSDWKTLNKVLQQGSLLGPPMFNIFMNDMFVILEMCEDYNYADDNTISDVKDTQDELKRSLEHDASNVTD